MESADVNFPADRPGGDDALESLLRRTGPALPDNGFSVRVLAALPPRQRGILRWRGLLLAGAGLAGFALMCSGIATAGGFSGVAAEFDTRFAPIEDALLQSASLPVDEALTLAVAATALSLFYVFRPRLRWPRAV